MATTITINGSVTLDESSGLQTSGISDPGVEDNNDSDVSIATLQVGALAFYSRLFASAGSGGLGLDTSFATQNGVAESASNFITVSGGTVTSLGFVDGNGSAMPTYSSGVDPSTGVATALTAVDGGAIHLFIDSSLGNRMVLGVDADGDIAFAIYMDPNAALSTARVWMVQFEAIANPNTSNPDDPVNLLDSIGVAASTSLAFDFSALPSGQNLFGTVGDSSNAIVVIGKSIALNADGTFTNSSNTINTSQGGGPTTIGVNNQMFDAGEGAYFTYVKAPNPNYLAGAPNGLNQNEADDADNIQYSGGTQEVTGASTTISQIQGNSLATMRITTYDIADSPQARSFVSGLGSGTHVNVTSVHVFDALGNDVTGTKVTISGGVATVTGLGAGYTVSWTTDAPHDRVLIENVAGKFDIGGFAIQQASSTSIDIGQQLVFEDSGPSIAAHPEGAPNLTVDETHFAIDDTQSFASQFTPSFGTDGPGATGVTYALSTPGGASGMLDTATGEAVVLSLEGGQVVGKTAISGDTVFIVSVDADGNVTLDQQRAVMHADPNNSDESVGLTGSDLVVLTATATDGDGDHAAAGLDLTALLQFVDDEPSVTATPVNAPTLTVDESFFANDDTKSFTAQFAAVFGSDGQGATPVSYELSTAGGASGLFDTATGEAIELSLVGGQIVGSTAISGDTVFVISVDADGNVTLDQQRAIQHADPDNPDESTGFTGTDLVVLTAIIEDGDGDHASAPLDITALLVFKDDGPSITASPVDAPSLLVDETTLAADDTHSYAGQFSPSYGSDGPGSTAVTYALSTAGGASGLTDTATGQAVILSLEGGMVVGRTAISGDTVFVVSVDAEGNVTLDQQRAVVHADPNDPDESTGLTGSDLVVLTATAIDGDGDHAAAPLDLTALLVFKDDGPSITADPVAPGLIVDETVLGTDATQSYAGQFTPSFGSDGAGAAAIGYALSTPGGASGLTDTATGQAVILSLVGGQVVGTTEFSGDTVFVVSVDADGNVTLDQQRAVVHGDPGDPDDAAGLVGSDLIVLTATATDGDGDQAAAPLDIGRLLVFEDDGPSITASPTGAPMLTVDETVLATNDTQAFAAQFTPVFGSDGAGAAAVSYALSTAGGASGLVDTASGESVVLSLIGGQIVGTTAISGDTVFVVSVDADGNVTLDQQRAVVHADPNDPDESTGLTGTDLVVLTATATDGDGDHAAAPLDLTGLLVFKDDGPAIGPVANSIVDFASGASATQNLHGFVGADPNSSPYAVESFTSSITVSGVELHGVASNNDTKVTYFADTNHDTIFGDAGDTAYYELDLSQTANGGAGSYTFDVLVNPPPSVLEFNFSALPSGQNLFGTVGDATNALVVIGAHPVLKADGTFSNASNTINTSQGGGPTTIGVNNQMFDATEGAYFTYVKNPDANYLAGAPNGLNQNEADDADNILYSGGTLEVTGASTRISQIQGNSLATMRITTYDIADSPQGRSFVSGLGSGTHVDITSVHVFDALGNDVTGTKVSISGGVATVTGLGAGYTVSWTTNGVHDRALIEDVAGKFDIGGFVINQPQPTPDQKLDFTVSATDGDGDFNTSTFSVGIDGTGIYHDGHVAGVLI